MTHIHEGDFRRCDCTYTARHTRVNVHQTEEPSPDVFDSNEAEAEEPSLRATDRLAEHVKSPLCGTKSLCHRRLIWQPQNRNWSFGKTRVSGRWVEAGSVELAAGHTNTATETLTSFTPVSVFSVPEGSTLVLNPSKFRPGRGRLWLQRRWSLGGRLQLLQCEHQEVEMHKCCRARVNWENIKWKKQFFGAEKDMEATENNQRGKRPVLEGDSYFEVIVMFSVF